MKLIIPDVHGRQFWRKAVKDWIGKVDKIIFLGDYLDPYPSENIGFDLAWETLLDIIDLKKSNPGKVILLWGNHDAHYHYLEKFKEWGRGSRFDYIKAPQANKLFNDNESLFQIAYQEPIGNKVFLFTHAGVCDGWVKQNNLTLPEESNLSNWLEGISPHELGDVGRSRGGWCSNGSPLWADWEENCWSSPILPNVFQIFGHTLDINPLRVTEHSACLDCKRPFLLSDHGVIGEIESMESNRYWKFIEQVHGLEFSEFYQEYMKFIKG